MKYLKSLFSSSWIFLGKSLSFTINPKSCSFFISSLTCSMASGSFCNFSTICLFCSSAVALFPFTELILNGLIGKGLTNSHGLLFSPGMNLTICYMACCSLNSLYELAFIALISLQVLHFEHVLHCTIMWAVSRFTLSSQISITFLYARCLNSSI